MADINKLKPFILKWEGGFVDDKKDLGGATNKGVTLKTYKVYCEQKGKAVPTVEDLKSLPDEEWTDILRKFFWDNWRADEIENQSIANILVDWVWASGGKGITIPQALLGVAVDGKVGEVTLARINGYQPQRELFDRIKKARLDYVDDICSSRPANEKFRNGWCNRINDFEFEENDIRAVRHSERAAQHGE